MKKRLRILLWTSAIFMLAGGLFGPLYAVFVEEIGGNLLTAGGAYAAFSIAAGVLIFFISRWEDRVKHQERLVVAGMAISCIGFLGYLWIETPIHLFIVQVVFGIGQAISTPAYDGLYSASLDKGRYASEWGMWESIAFLVPGIAAIPGAYIASVYGFQALFQIMFVFSLVGLAVATLLVRKG